MVTNQKKPFAPIDLGGIGSIVGGVGNLVSGFSQIGAAKRQHKYNLKEMEQSQKYALEQMDQSQQYNVANMALQNQYQIDAENRANEYNSAKAQVQRAHEAGISVATALGSGGANGFQSVSSSPSSSTPSSAGAPSPRGVSRPGINMDTSALGQLIAQIPQMRANVDATEANAEEARSRAYLNRVEAQGKEIDNYINENTKEIQINTAKLKEKGIQIENEINSFNASVQELRLNLDIKEQQSVISKINADMWRIYDQSKIDHALANANIRLMSSQIILNNANTELAGATTDERIAHTKLLGAQYLCEMSNNDLLIALKNLRVSEKDALDIQNELSKERAKFENEHRLENWKFERSSQRWQRAVNTMNSLSNVAQAACAVAGTVVTGGLGGTALVSRQNNADNLSFMREQADKPTDPNYNGWNANSTR